MGWPLLFNRSLVRILQTALDHEKRRCQELIELLQKVENRTSAALQYRSAAFPTINEEGWIETFDDMGQRVSVDPEEFQKIKREFIKPH